MEPRRKKNNNLEQTSKLQNPSALQIIESLWINDHGQASNNDPVESVLLK